ncbi:unnamed protein product [Urochloa decumbens]|uniref:Uncharacterized protein n=1 Tax=Urochloa decumbens TaxID=240449 RepID=A0ABC8XKC9_9POAL
MGVRARSTGLTRPSKLLLQAVALVALVVTAAHGARTGPWDGAPGHGGGAGAGGAAMRRMSALDVVEASQAGPSCCTHDPNQGGSSCCPHPQTLNP